MTVSVTPRQSDALEAISGFDRHHGCAPTFRELGELLGITSTNAVNDLLKILHRKGLVTRVPKSQRTLRLTPLGRRVAKAGADDGNAEPYACDMCDRTEMALRAERAKVKRLAGLLSESEPREHARGWSGEMQGCATTRGFTTCTCGADDWNQELEAALAEAAP